MIRFCPFLSATALLAIASVSTASAAPAGPVVKAPAGAGQGETQGDLNIFKGIPYAVPPVGKVRWTAPQPLPRWDGVKHAIAYGPSWITPTAVAQKSDDSGDPGGAKTPKPRRSATGSRGGHGEPGGAAIRCMTGRNSRSVA